MWEKIIRQIKLSWPWLLVATLAAFLRFWNLTALLHFTLDEELEAFIVKNIITGYHFPAIGVFAGLLGIHLSPIFYYLVAIPFWIGKLDPLVWGITASALGVTTAWFIYWTNREMFSQRVAVFSGLLYATSFLAVIYDKHFWNVTPLPFLSVLTVYSLYKIIKGKSGWIIPLSIGLAIDISAHLSAFILVGLVVFVWIRHRLPPFKKQVMAGIGIIALSQLPLLIFELRHNFLQTKTVLQFLSGEHGMLSLSRVTDNLQLLLRTFSRLIYTFGPHDLAREHTYGWAEIAVRDVRIPEYMIVVAFFLLAFFCWKALRKNRPLPLNLHFNLIIFAVIALTVGGVLFKNGFFEYYLVFLFPTLATVAAVFLEWLWLKDGSYRPVVAALLGIFLISNIYATLTSSHSYGLARKKELVSWVREQVGAAPYELHSIGIDHKYEGYRYLFERYYKAPVRSYVDPQLAWLYQTPVAPTSPSLTVVITSTEPAYQKQIDEERRQYLPFKIEERQFGEINVTIISRPSPPVAAKGEQE